MESIFISKSLDKHVQIFVNCIGICNPIYFIRSKLKGITMIRCCLPSSTRATLTGLLPLSAKP